MVLWVYVTMFSYRSIVYFNIILCSVISASWSVRGSEQAFTNDWVVKIEGGPAVADLIARKHGFINKGQVIYITGFIRPRKYYNLNNRLMIWNTGTILYMRRPQEDPEEV